jgi:sulfate adenylyltransferase subunit 1 (EFTu-like GTPase family)
MERSLASDVTHVNSAVQTADLVLFRTVRVNTISRDFPRFTQQCSVQRNDIITINIEFTKNEIILLC